MELLDDLRRRWSAVLGRAAERSAQAGEYRASIAEWEGRDGMSDVVALLRGKIEELGEPSSDEVEARVFLAGAVVADAFGDVGKLGDPGSAVAVALEGGVAYFPTAAQADAWREATRSRTVGGKPQEPAGQGAKAEKAESKKGRVSEVERRKVIGYLGKGEDTVEVSRKARRSVEVVRRIASDADIKLKVCEVCGKELSSAFFEERPGAHNLDDGLSRACKSCIKAHRGAGIKDAVDVAGEAATPLAAVPSIDPGMAAVLESCGIESVEDLLGLAEGLVKGELCDALRELEVPMGTAIHIAALMDDGTVVGEIGGEDGQQV